MNQENSKSSKISQMDNLKKREAGENVSIEENDHENETRKSLEDHLRIGASKTKVFIANIKQKGFYQLISAGKSKFESVFILIWITKKSSEGAINPGGWMLELIISNFDWVMISSPFD